MAIGDGLRRGTGSNDSMPGRRSDDWALGGFAIGGGGFGRIDWPPTAVSWR